MRRAAFAFSLLGFSLIPIAAEAQQPPTNVVPRERSKIVLNLPGFEGGGELYQYMGWDARYTTETSYGAQYPRNGDYPRAQVYLSLLSPGMVWTHAKSIDAAFIQNFAPFFRNRAIKMITSGGGGTNQAQRHFRFQVDAADCIYFSETGGFAVGGSTPGLHSGGGNLTPHVSGIYCTDQGGTLTDEDIAKIFKGYKVVQNPGK